MPYAEERAALEHILQSREFRRAPRLQRFLTFLCERRFEGKAGDLSEYLIAAELFGKSLDFNPAEDSIVRVEMRELRRRLREYHQNEGRTNGLILDLPAGSYVPTFVPRPNQSAGWSGWAPLPRWSWALLAMAVLAVAGAVHWLVSAGKPASQRGAAGASPQKSPVAAFWDRFSASDASTLLVLSNPPLFTLTENPGASESGASAVRLPESARSLLGAPATGVGKGPIFVVPARDAYTGIGEAMALHLITRAFQSRSNKLIVKQSRTLNADDFKYHNVILTGGSAVNLWTARLGHNLDFVSERMLVTNLRPRKGEQSQYSFRERKNGKLTTDYAVIALQDRRATGHWVVLLFGGRSEGTQAAAEAITSESFLEQLRSVGGTAGFPESFQALLSVPINDWVPANASPLAIHTR